MTAERRTPMGLRAAGRRLWTTTLEAFEPTEEEAVLLEAAARQLDELRDLEKALRGAPVMVVGSRNQERVNPLFAEVRAHRLALARLLGVLGLEADESAGNGTTRSGEARKLALLRWHGPRAAS